MKFWLSRERMVKGKLKGNKKTDNLINSLDLAFYSAIAIWVLIDEGL